MIVLETDRLVLTHLSPDADADFIFRLVNDPSFIRYIGDKKVRTLDDARQYIQHGPVKSYQENGFGLNKVELKESGVPIGISGLVKRDTLPDADIGFAFLPEFCGKGYAFESAAAVMNHARDTLKLKRILAITTLDNERSARLLGRIGLKFERVIKLSEDAAEVRLFSSNSDGSV
jgi:RimJ/RimL family protein N-acetyltransferase